MFCTQLTDLPPELAAFASLLDAHLCLRPKCRQPAPVREAFRYCLALAMVEAGKARLVGQEPQALNVEQAIEECSRLADIAEALSGHPAAETEAARVARSLAHEGQ